MHATWNKNNPTTAPVKILPVLISLLVLLFVHTLPGQAQALLGTLTPCVGKDMHSSSFNKYSSAL